MSDRGVKFDSIEIARALGIQKGEGFSISSLSPGINLIHGPNGSGKSTLISVIHELLWPGRKLIDRPTVAGSYDDGDDHWEVDIDAGHVECSINGKAGLMPDFGPPQFRRRYHLALHELVGDDGDQFAAAVAEASQGGYDLDGAAEACGFLNKPRKHPKERAAVKEARATVRNAQARQLEVEGRESELSELESKKIRAIEASKALEALRVARGVIEAKIRAKELQSELDLIPTPVSLLFGNERAELDRLGNEWRQAEEEREATEQQIELAERELAGDSLPESASCETIVDQLTVARRKLASVEQKIERARSDLTGAEETAHRALRRLGDLFSEEQLSGLESVELADLTRFSREAARTIAARHVTDEMRRELERDADPEITDIDRARLQEAIVALGHWLSKPVPPGGRPEKPWFAALAALVGAALAAALAYFQHPGWLLALLPLTAIPIIAWWRERTSTAELIDERTTHRRSFEASGFDAPITWEVEHVEEKMRQLSRLSASAEADEHRRKRLGVVADREDAVEEAENRIKETKADLEDRLGVRIEIAEEWLPLLVENITRWQSESGKAASVSALINDDEIASVGLLERINQLLDEVDGGRAESADSAEECIERLRTRIAQRDAAKAELESASHHLASRVNPRLERLEASRAEIFSRLEIDESRESEIDDWLAAKPRFKELTAELARVINERDTKLEELSGNDHLATHTIAEIESCIVVEKAAAESLESHIATIASIETDIGNAKRGHQLSEALEASEVALESLADARERNREAVVGGLLTTWIRKTTVDKARPPVFKRANELLARFTGGALKLDMNDVDGPAEFLASSGDGPARPVQELSVGERVQTLMAIRLAFAQQDERAKMPILLDETLGTSDDRRAGAVIDTLIEVARDGRQIFYFTAQPDEVGKWKSRLGHAGVEHAVFDLEVIRGKEACRTRPLQIDNMRKEPLPSPPEGISYGDYGHMLGVPGLDPSRGSVEATHLWHFLDDTARLHRFLSRGISSWGQLKTLHDADRLDLVDADHEEYLRAAAAAEAMTAAWEAWNIGRGLPVDREAIEDSESAGSFIDRIVERARSVNGDAAALVHSLETDRPLRWQVKNTIRLKQYLEENGYLPAEEPLSRSDIRLRVIITSTESLRSGAISEALIERMVELLPIEEPTA